MACGRTLAAFINRELGISSCSFVSHSLGARLVFEAVLAVDCAVRDVCVMAAAVDDDALSTAEYAAVLERAKRVSVLASLGDRVLRLAYPAGDFASDLAYDDDSPFAVHSATAARGRAFLRPRSMHRSAIVGMATAATFRRSTRTMRRAPRSCAWRPSCAKLLCRLPHAWPP